MARFDETFTALRSVLEAHAARMMVTVDKPGHFELASRTQTDRVGRPLFCAAVKVNKVSVSYHLMPLYADKTLRDAMSPTLRKHMKGKACLSFTTVEAGELEELAAITKRGIAGFRHLKLPWA
jgi:hypothetical protein